MPTNLNKMSDISMTNKRKSKKTESILEMMRDRYRTDPLFRGSLDNSYGLTKHHKDDKFIRVHEWVLQRRELTVSAKLVYGYLLSRSYDRGFIFTDVKRMASETGLSERTTRRAVELLERMKLLYVHRAEKGEQLANYIPNVYIVHKSWLLSNYICPGQNGRHLIRRTNKKGKRKGISRYLHKKLFPFTPYREPGTDVKKL